MLFLTNFADQAVVLPLTLVTASMLALTGWKRGAMFWLVAVAATLGTMAALKIAFFTCGPAHLGGLVRSPSGHTASAAIAYGGLAALTARRCGVGLTPAFLAVPAAAALIGFSRIELAVHTLPEVLIGGLVGCLGALGFLVGARKPPPWLSLFAVVGPALFVAVMMHGNHLRSEDTLHNLASSFAWLAAFCTAHGQL
jgi:membrane-associated phospholipid phosphatase